MEKECGSPVARLRGVHKRYRATWALRGVSLEVPGPGVFVLYGPNGSGKSTIISLLTGVTLPTRGEVLVTGVKPGLRPSRVLRRIVAAVEGTGLPLYMSGERVALSVAKSRGSGLEPIAEVAERLGVTKYWGRPLFTYSMGMRKKLLLSIALGLAPNSCLLLLDEPYTLLDRESREKVAREILSIARTTPVLVATHIITRAEMAAEAMFVLDNGRLVKTLRAGEARSYECPLTGETLEWAAREDHEHVSIDRRGRRVLVKGAATPPPTGCRPVLLPPSDG